MRHQGLIAFFAVLLCTASVFFYVFEKKIGGDYELVKKEGFFRAWQIKSQEEVAEQLAAEEAANKKAAARLAASSSDLQVSSDSKTFEQRTLKATSDMEGSGPSTQEELPLTDVAVPELKAPLIRQIPWENWEIKKEFNQASSRSCKLLPPGSAVQEGLKPRNVQKTLFEARPTAFTVGLRIDPLFRGQLPTISKSTIEGYLDDHLLAIQPVVAKTAAGYSFTGEVRSAFFHKNSPTRTIEPEGMIASAVQEFRVLGIYDESTDGQPSRGKTLVMAFRFMKQENELSLVIEKPVEAFELMLLHLPKETESDEVEVLSFATSGNRQEFQFLSAVNSKRPSDLSSVQANIRFEEFRMMGMYPSRPIVTGIQNRIQSSIPVKDMQKKLSPLNDLQTVMLSTVLDEFVN